MTKGGISCLEVRNDYYNFFEIFIRLTSINFQLIYLEGSSILIGGACWAKAFSNSDITTARKFLMTSSKGLAPKALETGLSQKCWNILS